MKTTSGIALTLLGLLLGFLVASGLNVPRADAQIQPPPHMQGVAFLGQHPAAPRELVFGHRDPMDERTDIAIEQVPVVYRFGSLDDWWDTQLDISTSLARAVGTLSPAQRDDLRDAIDARLAQYVAADGAVALPGLTHVAAASA